MPQYALLDVWDQGIPVLPYSFFVCIMVFALVLYFFGSTLQEHV